MGALGPSVVVSAAGNGLLQPLCHDGLKMPAHGLGEKVILGFCLLLFCSFLMLTVTCSVVARLPGLGLVKTTARGPVEVPGEKRRTSILNAQ